MSQSDVYIYGMTVLSTTHLLKGIRDHETVRFAAACATSVCTRFPSIRQPPDMEEILALINSQNG